MPGVSENLVDAIGAASAGLIPPSAHGRRDIAVKLCKAVAFSATFVAALIWGIPLICAFIAFAGGAL